MFRVQVCNLKSGSAKSGFFKDEFLLRFYENIAEAVELVNEECFEIFSAFAECGIAIIVEAAIVEDLGHVLDKVAEAIVVAIQNFRLNLFEICKNLKVRKVSFLSNDEENLPIGSVTTL